MPHGTETKIKALDGVIRQWTVLVMGLALLLFGISCSQMPSIPNASKEASQQTLRTTEQDLGEGTEKPANPKTMTRNELAKQFEFDPNMLEPGPPINTPPPLKQKSVRALMP